MGGKIPPTPGVRVVDKEYNERTDENILRDPPCKEEYVRSTTVPFKPLTNNVKVNLSHFLDWKIKSLTFDNSFRCFITENRNDQFYNKKQ